MWAGKEYEWGAECGGAECGTQARQAQGKQGQAGVSNVGAQVVQGVRKAHAHNTQGRYANVAHNANVGWHAKAQANKGQGEL